MKQLALIGCLLLLALFVGPAAAHSDLVAAEPEPGAQLSTSPAEIRLTFSEPVAANSQIVLLTGGFQPVEGVVAQFNPDQPEQVYTSLPELDAGVYTVQWSAVSDDGHEVSGSYSFSIVPDTPAAAGEQPAAAPTRSGRAGWWLALLLIAAVAAPLLLLLTRRASKN